MNRLRREFLTQRFGRFVLVGGFAAGVNLVSRVLLSLVFTYAVAVALAYAVGMATAYTMNTFFVFDASGKGHGRQVSWFVLVNIVGLAQTLGISLLLAGVVLPWCGVVAFRQEIAHVIGVGTPVFTSYLGHKYLTFR